MDEAARLKELVRYAVLDTPPEPNFDRITTIAAAVFDQPICTMAFADADRHWFKSRYGVAATEMPRQLSFCNYTIRGDEVFVVPDAAADPRFVDAPVVAGPPHVRFYAGAPLIVPSGAHIGTLCLLGPKPGSFDAKQRRILLDLARTAVELLEARSRQMRMAERSVEIAHLAQHDPLTKLANRRLFSDHMEEAISQIGEERQAAVLLVDLDRFKPVNDSLGHQAGDALLQQVAERLLANLRSTDKVARIGGDEFAVVQLGPQARRHAADMAARLITALSAPYHLEGCTVTIGASIGIALVDQTEPLSEQIFQHADNALYQAKSRGGGTYCFYDTGTS